MAKEKLTQIPIREWMTLAIGIVFFGIINGILYLYGYSNLLINAVVSFIITGAINYFVFSLKNKMQKIVSAIGKLITLLLTIPKLIQTAGRYFVIVLLNLIMIPILAVYLTIYGMLFSLSGGANKIMFEHYDAFGHRMIKPIEKYLQYETVVGVITIGIILAVSFQILSAFQSASSITTADTTLAASGNGLTALGTLTSYLPVFAITLAIGIIIYLLMNFMRGASGFASAA